MAADFREQLDTWKSMRTLTKERLSAEFKKVTSEKEGFPFVLVLDDTTFPIVHSCFGNFDLLQMGCTSVGLLKKRQSRSPQRSMDVVYFIKPTDENVAAICDDWQFVSEQFHKCFCPCGAANTVTYKVPAFMYNEAHIFTTDRISSNHVGVIKRCEGLRGNLITLKQLKLHYSAIESNVFSLNMANDIQNLFISVCTLCFSSLLVLALG